MSNKMNNTESTTKSPTSQDNMMEKSNDTMSTTLIQKNLPQHHLGSQSEQPAPAAPATPVAPLRAKEKWSFLKSNLQSAVSDWAELEKQPAQKTPEEEQLDKMRSLISNLKERLAEF